MRGDNDDDDSTSDDDDDDEMEKCIWCGSFLTETFHQKLTQEMQKIKFASQAQLLCMSYASMNHFVSFYIHLLHFKVEAKYFNVGCSKTL